MSDTLFKPARRILDPIDRVSEVLFGMIMVLTFPASLSVAEAGREDVRVMLIAAVGCNTAWGIIDAILHLMGRLADKSRELATYRAVREAADPQHALRASNAVAIAILFVTGYIFGRLTGGRPVWMGGSMVVLGAILVGLTMALAG